MGGGGGVIVFLLSKIIETWMCGFLYVFFRLRGIEKKRCFGGTLYVNGSLY